MSSTKNITHKYLGKIFPVINWLGAYQLPWLRHDIIAGITLAAFIMPESLAYASLAGLPPVTGIYCCLLGGIGYVIFGSSKHLAVGPTSAISLLIGVSLVGIVGGNMEMFFPVVTLTTLLVAAIFFISYIFRLNVIVNFISESTLIGFKAGAALSIISTQLHKLFGVSGGGNDFFSRVYSVLEQISNINIVVLLVGIGALALLISGDIFLKGKPVALGVVVLSLIIIPLFQLNQYNIHIVGELPAGLPSLLKQNFNFSGINILIFRDIAELAFACFLLSYIESVSAGRTFAIKHHYEIDSRQELLALGSANMLTGLFQGYPSAGGLSQSVVNESAGAKTSLSLVFASSILVVVLLFLTGLLKNLPEVILASIVLVAVSGLIKIKEFKHYWKVSKIDFYASVFAFGGVLLLGILDGVILAVIASLVMLLLRIADPHIAILGRIPGTDRFSDIKRHPDNETFKGLMIVRVEAMVLYFNAEHIFEKLMKLVNENPDTKFLVWDFSSSSYLDITGIKMILRLHKELELKNINFRIAEALAEIRDIMRAEGLEEKIGRISRKVSLEEIVEEYLNNQNLNSDSKTLK